MSLAFRFTETLENIKKHRNVKCKRGSGITKAIKRGE
jgi:hypothetical protein